MENARACAESKECTPEAEHAESGKNENSTLSGLISALGSKGKSGLLSEDFLLLGLIALLIGKEGNEDILLILAMLLLT